jgi:hypothetical protein
VASDDLLQPGVVRSVPVDVSAVLAPGESLLGAQGPWLEMRCNLRPGDWTSSPSAGQAQDPRLEAWPKPLDDVSQLVVAVLPAHKGSTAQHPTHQQAPVPAERHPVLSSSLLDELAIVSVLAVRVIGRCPDRMSPGRRPPAAGRLCRVDAQETKPAGQRTQVHIQQGERRPLQRLRPCLTKASSRS